MVSSMRHGQDSPGRFGSEPDSADLALAGGRGTGDVVGGVVGVGRVGSGTATGVGASGPATAGPGTDGSTTAGPGTDGRGMDGPGTIGGTIGGTVRGCTPSDTVVESPGQTTSSAPPDIASATAAISEDATKRGLRVHI